MQRVGELLADIGRFSTLPEYEQYILARQTYHLSLARFAKPAIDVDVLFILTCFPWLWGL